METLDETNTHEGETLQNAVRMLTQEVTELRRLVTLQSATTHDVPQRVDDAPRRSSRARSPTNFDEQSDDRGSIINKKRQIPPLFLPLAEWQDLSSAGEG